MHVIRAYAPSGVATLAVVDSLSSPAAERLRAEPTHGILVAEDMSTGRYSRVIAGGWQPDPEWPRVPASAAA